MQKLENQNIEGFRCLVVPGKPGGPCVVLFHGFGADATDLMPLGDMMNIPDVTWIFPEGPLEVIVGPGMYGRAWWQIDSRRLEAAMVSGEPLDMSKLTPQGFEPAAKQGQRFYEALRARYSKIILGGFSQGAMLATEISLAAQHKPQGLVIMSGTLLNEDRWRDLAEKNNKIVFFQSHGKNDVLLGYAYAERLFEVLSDAGLNGEFMQFSGGHEIPPKVIEKISQFVRSRIR